jgi:hypothetical protein
MNFQKSWDIDFQKFLDCDIFLKILKLLNFGNNEFFFFFKDRFCVVDLVDLVDLVDFVDILKSSEKELTFIFLIQSILFS